MYYDIVCVQLTWLNPTESQYNIQWDDQMCPGGSRKLFAKAYKEALTPSEQEELIQEFKSDIKLVFRVGLTPQKVRLFTLGTRRSRDKCIMFHHYSFPSW